MIPSRLPEILLVGEGRIGERCAELLEPRAQVTRARTTDPLPATRDVALVVLALDHPYPPLCRAIDEACRSEGTAWTSVTLMAHEIRVGPGIRSGKTPCFACFERRVRSLAPDLETHAATLALASSGERRPWFAGELRAITEQAASVLAAEALAMTRGELRAPPHMGHFWEADAIFGILRGRVFARVGRCGVCARAEQRGASWRGLAERFAPGEVRGG